MGETCRKRMQAFSLSQLSNRTVWKRQLIQVGVAIAIGGKDDSLSIRSEGAIQKIEVMVDGGLTCKLVDNRPRLFIPELEVLRREPLAFSKQQGVFSCSVDFCSIRPVRGRQMGRDNCG